MATFSSAIDEFAPKTALHFFNALRAGRAFPIRNRRAGYACLDRQGGARVAGLDCGPIRSSVLDPTPEEPAGLSALMKVCETPATGRA
jgi:5-dehydro-4-deoxyglucarate dehydratase